jgi:hypothetical protein
MQRWIAGTPLLSEPSVIAPTIPSPTPSLAMTVAGIDAGEVRRSNRRKAIESTANVPNGKDRIYTVHPNHLDIGDFGDRRAVPKYRLYELPVVLQYQRLTFLSRDRGAG